ncbi:hypothetical protein PRUB_a4052 [Pseudoalteromonas rubra]|uniref:HTH cro/C1-type domain-containing protein n=1 Tax=Pseudoalteromonas rubra TaxID=43658 RepID=A0A8T0C903_9GAMM|nr:helix-turn-helix transcriptional regulator [Pseudoalteromonas rubra]KAF7787176.1 hypothetical protein PRUB_a4052 [Pseudoalteromonas rubra]
MKAHEIKPMSADQIKQALSKKGYSLSVMAEAIGVSLTAVSGVISRQTQSLRIAEAIAKVLGKPVGEVFSDCPHYVSPRKHRRQDQVQAVQQLLAS